MPIWAPVVSPLHLAAHDGNVAEVQRLLLLHADRKGYIDSLNAPGFTVLTVAVVNGQLDMVRVLLAAGCDKDKVSSDGKTALAAAAECDHVEVVQKLIASGCHTQIFPPINWWKLMGCTKAHFQFHWFCGFWRVRAMRDSESGTSVCLNDDCKKALWVHLLALQGDM